jgi:sterol desaturase/sphingolipid hydroxylase (fatty acid hydroxylase superfamily)
MLTKLNYQDLETISLLGCGLLFILLERCLPKNRSLDVRGQFKLDVTAFIFLVISVNFSRWVASEFYETLAFKKGLLSLSGLPFIFQLMAAHLLSDFVLYWIHRGMHSNKLLWRTHEFHHSIDSLYWFSGFRTSFLHTCLYAFPQVLIGFYFFDFTSFELGIAFSLGVFFNIFIHSNIILPEWLPLHWIFVTPDFHHPHHSQLGTQNKNFANVFTIWDRLFGTYVPPKKIRKDFKYGLKEKSSLIRMMIGL